MVASARAALDALSGEGAYRLLSSEKGIKCLNPVRMVSSSAFHLTPSAQPGAVNRTGLWLRECYQAVPPGHPACPVRLTRWDKGTSC